MPLVSRLGKPLRPAPGVSGRLAKLRGQAIAEFALISIFLCLLLAAVVDFGRAFYTAGIVTNMAGEGAAFAALFPDQEIAGLGQVSCSMLPVSINKSIQERARRVAKDRGLVVERQDQNLATIDVYTEGFGPLCSSRCAGRTITVRVTYRLDDLFLPGFLGVRNIAITRSASQVITRNVQRNSDCSEID